MVVVVAIDVAVVVDAVAVSPMVKAQKDKRIQRTSQRIHLMSQQKVLMAQRIAVAVAVAQQEMASHQVKSLMKMA
jgi:uncharacterized protein YfeS